MQKLNRFVTYIYSYRDSQRDTNVGLSLIHISWKVHTVKGIGVRGI